MDEALLQAKAGTEHTLKLELMNGIPELNLGNAYQLSGRWDKAEKCFELAFKISRKCNKMHLFLDSMNYLAQIKLSKGQLKHAYNLFSEAIRISSENYNSKTLASNFIYLGLSSIYYEYNRLEEALECLEKCIKLSVKRNDNNILIQAYIIMIKVVYSKGDCERAQELINIVYEMKKNNKHNNILNSRVSDIIRILILTGEKSRISYFFDSNEIEDCENLDFFNISKYIAHSDILISKGLYNETLDILNKLHRYLEKNENITALINVLILEAISNFHLGNTSAALSLIKKSLSMTCNEGFINTYCLYEEDIYKLLFELDDYKNNSGKIAEHYFQLMFHLKNNVIPVACKKIGICEVLSNREIEVLKYVYAGLSNREIAMKLYVTPSTVKKHLNSLYNKLEVQNRTQAISIAMKYNII